MKKKKYFAPLDPESNQRMSTRPSRLELTLNLARIAIGLVKTLLSKKNNYK